MTGKIEDFASRKRIGPAVVRPKLTQDDARALADAGYLPIPEYLLLCERRGRKVS